MREIVEIAVVERVFQLLAVAAPVAGLVLGAVLRRGAVRGLLIGLLATLNWLLWRVYNLLTDRNGLDSVGNLLLNVGLFAVLGIAAGMGYAYFQRRPQALTKPEIGEASE